MFFSYSSSSITLIDIVLLEQRRRNRDSRVRGEEGGGRQGEEEEGGNARRRWLRRENSGFGGTAGGAAQPKAKGRSREAETTSTDCGVRVPPKTQGATQPLDDLFPLTPAPAGGSASSRHRTSTHNTPLGCSLWASRAPTGKGCCGPIPSSSARCVAEPLRALTSIWQQRRHFTLSWSKQRQALGGTARMIPCAVRYESEVY